MDTKIIRKVTSILMVAIIIGSTLSTPIVNIGKVVAETYNNADETTDDVNTEIDSTPSDIEDVATTDETAVPAEVDTSDTETSDVTIQEPTGTDVNKVEPASSSVPEDSAQPDSSTASSSTSISPSAIINPTANDPPYAGEPYFEPNSGPFCGEITSNSGAPKFHGLAQFNANQGNFLTVDYNGGSDGIPQGYAATYVTFYDPNNAGSESADTIAYGPVKLNAPAPTWDFAATSPASTEKFMNIEIDPEHLPVVLNLLNGGQLTLKYAVTYQNPTTGGCIRKVSNSAHTDNFVPFIKKPTFTATQACTTDCDVNLTLNFTGSDYSSHSRYIVERYAGSTATGTPTTIINEEITNSGVNTINFTDTTIPSPGGTYTYKFYIDLNGVNTDEFNPVASPDATLTVSDKPTGSITNVDRQSSSSFDVHYNIDFKNYSIASNTLRAYIEMYRVTPGAPETLTKVATSTDITANATGGTSFRNFDASAYGPGTYRFKLVVDYGTKVGSEFPCNLALFSSDFKVFGQPTITPSQSCDVECTIHLAFGYDASQYTENDVLVLLKDGVFVNTYDLTTTSIDLLLESNIFTSHSYSFYIDTNDVPNDNNLHTRDAFEPLSNVAPYTLLQKPELGTVNTTIVGNDQINVDFTANLYNSGAQVRVQIDGGPLQTPTLNAGVYRYSFTDLDYGPHTVKVIIKYARNGIDCPDIFDTSTKTIPTPAITITPSQACNIECTVHLAFSYNASDYDANDVLVLLKDGVFVNAYDLTTNSIDLVLATNIFDEHNYSFYIDTNDVPNDNNLHSRDAFETLSNVAEYTLLQKPDLGEVTTEIVGNDRIDVDFTANLYNSGALVRVQIDGGTLQTPTLDDEGYHYSFTGLDYGPHTVKVVISYERDGIDCPDIFNTSTVTIPTPAINIIPSQSCDVECTIHLAFDYDAEDYAEGDMLVLLKDGVFVNAYDLTTNSIDLVLATNIFDEHNYSFYIDTNDVPNDNNLHSRDSFETLSNIAPYTLLQKPDLGEVTTTVVGTNRIDVDFTANLYNSGALVRVQIDGGALQTPTLDNEGYHYSFTGLDYGPHTVKVVITYERDGVDCPDIFNTSTVTIPTSAIAITPSQSCDVECTVHLEFDYNAEEYAENDVLVLLKDGVFVAAYDLTTTSTDLELLTAIFSLHNYSFYIDTNDVPNDNNLHSRDAFETLSNIAQYTLLQKPDLGDITTTVIGTDQIDVDFTANLYNSGALVRVQIDGGALQTPTLDDEGYHYSFTGLDYGPHTVKVVISYERDGIDCPDIFDTSTKTIPTPAINIIPSQSCDVECIVHLAFDYDAEDYAEGDVLVLLKDGVFVNAYDLTTNSIDLELATNIFSEHNYSFYIDTNDVPNDNNLHTRDAFETLSNIAPYTLLQKPDLGEVTTEIVGNDRIDVDFTANLYNSGASVRVQIDGGTLQAPTLDGEGYHYSFTGLDYGPHTVKVVITYERDGVDCPDIFDTSTVTIPTPAINITPSQSCDVECIVHLAFDYNAEDYAENDVLVLLKDGVFVGAYDLTTDSIDLELLTAIFSLHNYSFYIDTNDVPNDNNVHSRDAFETLSNVAPYTLLQKPDLGEVTTEIVGTNRIDVDFTANLYNSGALVRVQIDGGALQMPTLDDEGYHYSFTGLDYGPHTVKVVITYERDGVDCPDIFNTSTVTIPTSAITITPSQSCDVECTVHLAFDYNAEDYAENDVLVLLKDGVFVAAYDLTTDSIDLELLTAIFSLHNYSFYIDTNDVPNDNNLHTRDAFETLSNIAQYTLLQKPDLGDITTTVIGTDQIDVDFTANLYNSGALVRVQIDGGALQTPTLDDEGYHYSFTGLDYGPHTVKVVITYERDGVDCPDIFDTSTKTIPTPAINIIPSQSCDVECIVHLAFDYDAEDYAEGDVLVLLKDGVFVNAYDLTTNSIDLELATNIFSEHNYSFYIDTNDVPNDNNLHSRDSFETLSNIAPYTLLQKPDLGEVITEIVGNDRIDVDFTANLYNSGALVRVQIDGGALQTPTLDDEGYHYSFTGLDYGPHTVKVVIMYERDGINCPDIFSTSTVTIPTPAINIIPSQSCDVECIVHLAFDYNAEDYAENDVLVLLKDGVFVDAYDLTTDSIDLELVANIFSEHNYSFYIDTNDILNDNDVHTRDAFETLSNIAPYTLLQKPDLGEVTTEIVGNDRIDVDFTANLYNSGAQVRVQIDGGALQTPTLDDEGYHCSFTGLDYGPHTVKVVITYEREGVDCPDIFGTSTATISTPATTITPSQSCDVECKVHLAFDYDAQDYAENDVLVLLKDGVFVDAYDLTTNSIDLELISDIFSLHNYSFYIDTNDVADDNNLHTRDAFETLSNIAPYTLLQKPDLGEVTTTVVGTDQIDVDFTANLYNSGASVRVQIDGGALQTPTLDGEDYHYSFMGLDYGPHTIKVVIMYERDGVDCPDVFDISTVTIQTPDTTITPTQSCDVECTVHLAFGYDAQDYAENDVLVLLKDGVFVDSYDLTTTSIDLELTSDIFSLHNYSFYIDTNDVADDDNLHTRDSFETLSNIAPYTLLQKPELLEPVVITPDRESNSINVNFDTKLYNSSAKVSVKLDENAPVDITSDGVFDEETGITTFDYTIMDAAYGSHNVSVIIDYSRSDVECPAIINEYTTAIPFPDVSITPSQVCGKECIVELAFDYDAADYPEGSKLVLLKDDQFVEAFDLDVLNTSLLLDTAIFEDHDYSFYIDTNPIIVEENPGLVAATSVTYERDSFETLSNIEHFTLQQRPDVSNVTATLDSFDRVNVDADIDLHNSGARVFIQLDNGPVRDVTDLIGSGKLRDVLTNLTPGEHDIYLTVQYTRMGLDCPDLQEHVSIVVNALETPTIAASQDCNKDCIVDLSLGYDASVYPGDSDVVVLQDGKEVLRYMISDMSHKVEGSNLYNYELTVKDFLSHNYVVYIDTNLADEFDAYSKEIDFRLLQKPEIKTFEMVKNEDSSITIDFKAILHDYADATGMIVITGPNGYTKTINADSLNLSSGSYTIDKLAAGTYNATFTINFGEDCKPIVLEATPVTIEPKLVYTGLETGLFETIIIEIKEIFVNAA